MTRATPKMRDFAKRLIAHEAKGNNPSKTKSPGTSPVSEKLRPHLVAFMGNMGFRALLSRALALASAEVPWLRAVHVKADGSLEGLDQLEAEVAPNEILEGRVVLVAELVGLLVVLIGEKLSLGMMSDVWPKLLLNDLDLSAGAKNEKSE